MHKTLKLCKETRVSLPDWLLFLGNAIPLPPCSDFDFLLFFICNAASPILSYDFVIVSSSSVLSEFSAMRRLSAW